MSEASIDIAKLSRPKLRCLCDDADVVLYERSNDARLSLPPKIISASDAESVDRPYEPLSNEYFAASLRLQSMDAVVDVEIGSNLITLFVGLREPAESDGSEYLAAVYVEDGIVVGVVAGNSYRPVD